MKILCNGNSAQHVVSDSAEVTIEDDYTFVNDGGDMMYVMFVTRKMGANVVENLTPPEDFEQGRYLLIDGEFVADPTWVPYTPPASPPPDPLREQHEIDKE